MTDWVADCLASHNNLRAKHGAGRQKEIYKYIFRGCDSLLGSFLFGTENGVGGTVK